MSGSVGDNVFRASGVIAAAAAGRKGTVDWDTSIHTGTVTAETAKGYFVNTTSGGITVNLPAAAVGSIVAVSDYASTAASNNITVTPNGSDKINGVNDDYIISTAGLAVTLVYADATRGWKSVTGSDADATGVTPAYVVATGGTPCAGATSGDYKIHSFTGPGTLCVSAAGNCAGNNKIDFLVVAGGGGGGWCTGGGGGAGGYRESKQPSAPWTASPIVATPCSGTNGITASVSAYPIAVGAAGGPGGPPGACSGGCGGDSTFSTITSTGGGGGGGRGPAPQQGETGGSGGGGGGGAGPGNIAGNTPPTTPPQGNQGGNGDPGPWNGTGGGGGATAGGTNAQQSPFQMGPGGAGATTCISASPVAYGGGGGGGSGYPNSTAGTGGTGGGGAGAGPGGGQGAGTTNRGGGGGGGAHPAYPQVPGASGGSGIVIVRYKFQ